MPTPFYHLSLAQSLLDHPALLTGIRQFLRASQCAFLFGNTAPDVQVVSGQARQATHFFDLPIQAGAPLAWEVVLAANPGIAQADALSDLHAAFLAGYLCHLQADWMWVKEIFAPAFGPYCTWGNFRQRLYYHNVLRAYLDERVLPRLPSGIDACLNRVVPDHWLPFVADQYLVLWRDLLFPQLKPGAGTRTVEVFSSRGDVPAPEFYAILNSEARMQQEVFEHIPLQLVHEYHQHVLEENIALLSNYLAARIIPDKKAMMGKIIQGVQP